MLTECLKCGGQIFGVVLSRYTVGILDECGTLTLELDIDPEDVAKIRCSGCDEEYDRNDIQEWEWKEGS